MSSPEVEFAVKQFTHLPWATVDNNFEGTIALQAR